MKTNFLFSYYDFNFRWMSVRVPRLVLAVAAVYDRRYFVDFAKNQRS
jgi:hypothetical protein